MRIVEINKLGLVSFHISNTPIEFLERCELSQAHRSVLCERVRMEVDPNMEIVPLLTCNRVEYYFYSSWREEVEEYLLNQLACKTGIPVGDLNKYVQMAQGEEVMDHLFRVAAGLNSLTLGEYQIQGQVKQAYRFAQTHGFIKRYLLAVFERALRTGKRVRSETLLGSLRISLSSTAIDCLRQLHPLHDRMQVLIIGTGKMGKLAADYFHRVGLRNIIFFSQDPPNREHIHTKYNADVLPMDCLMKSIDRADIIFAAYGSRNVFIKPEMIKPHLPAREKPLYIIDIGMPRDVDSLVKELRGIHLIDFEMIQKHIRKHRQHHQTEIVKAETIVTQEFLRFQHDQEIRLIKIFQNIENESIRETYPEQVLDDSRLHYQYSSHEFF